MMLKGHEIKDSKNEEWGNRSTQGETLSNRFHELLESDLPPSTKGVQRLGDEAQTIIGARLETIAWALTVATFHILDNPNILKKLAA
jgi:hypothetical protein